MDLTEALADAAERVYEVNEANGWFENERTVGDDLALLHSEVSEALEAFRDHGLEDATTNYVQVRRPWWRRLLQPRVVVLRFDPNPKPEGFGSEAADVLVRLLDTCKRRGVDLGYEFERKLAYNATRGHRHGGKRL